MFYNGETGQKNKFDYKGIVNINWNALEKLVDHIVDCRDRTAIVTISIGDPWIFELLFFNDNSSPSFRLVACTKEEFNFGLNLCLRKSKMSLLLLTPREMLSNERWQVNCLQIEMPYDVRVHLPKSIRKMLDIQMNKKYGPYWSVCVCRKWNPTFEFTFYPDI